MRIVVVFLAMLAVSVFGISMLMRSAPTAEFDVSSVLANLTHSDAAPAPPPPGETGGDQQAAPPASAPAAQAPALPTPRQLAPGEGITFTVHQGETTGSIGDRLTQMGL